MFLGLEDISRVYGAVALVIYSVVAPGVTSVVFLGVTGKVLLWVTGNVALGIDSVISSIFPPFLFPVKFSFYVIVDPCSL